MLSSLALHCVGWEGLQTSLKPEEAFIYLYDGRMVGMSEIGSIQVMSHTGYVKSMVLPTAAC